MEDNILLAHGSGGKLSHQLIKDLFLPQYDNPVLAKLDDAAKLRLTGDCLAYTTDSYVVNPLFFKGGDIGRLAVCGTVNDLAMTGAKPLYLTASFIIEEGLPLAALKKILISMKQASEEAIIEVVAGDTKVVEKGAADKLFITTSGIGVIEKGLNIAGANAKAGDRVILSGDIAEHGVAILVEREGMELDVEIKSDVAPLNHLVAQMLKVSRKIRCLRDPTRGGLATTLNELATQSEVGIRIEEDKLPIKEGVRGVCEILGLDPLYVGNEGKLVAVVDPEDSQSVLEKMRQHPYGTGAQIIGEVVEKPTGRVFMKTSIGGSRIVDMLAGEQLPRIC